MDHDQELRTTPLFENLGDEEAAALEAIAEIQDFSRGQLLFQAGDTARVFYLVLGGTVRVHRISPEGKKLTLHLVRRPHLFAEAAVFGMGTYPASAEAVDDVRCAAFPGDAFQQVLREHPAVSIKVIASLSSWIRALAQKMEERTQVGVPARVAKFVLEESQRQGADQFRLSQNKSLLAEQMGMTSESFSRALRRLQDQGLISVHGRDFGVLDPEGLHRIAGA